MSTTSLPVTGQPAAPPQGGLRKLLELAVIRKTAGDFLTFFDDTKETIYPYLYHRTGSVKSAQSLMTTVYLEVLSRALSLFWFGNLSTELLLKIADKAIAAEPKGEADIDAVYLPGLQLKEDQRKSVATMHDALWSLPAPDQRVIVLSVLMGLSDQRMATMLRMSVQQVKAMSTAARTQLMQRWQPAQDMTGSLDALSFLPALDLTRETNLRSAIVDKYSALRMRRYQWVIAGAMLAVFSNFLVAGILGFVVITQPPTSLRGPKTEVAALDAILLKRQLETAHVKESLNASFEESKGLAAFDATRDFTNLGLAAALESLKHEQTNESQVDKLIKMMQKAGTAYVPGALQYAWSGLHDLIVGTAEAKAQLQD